LAHVLYVLEGTRHAKFCGDGFKGFCSPNVTDALLVVTILCFLEFLQLGIHPERILAQNTSFRWRMDPDGYS